MTIDEYMAKHCLTYKQVYGRIKKKSLPAEKRGKEWFIFEESQTKIAPAPSSLSSRSGNLKDALTAVQIKKIQQQLDEGKEKIRQEYKAEVIDDVMAVLNKLGDRLSELRLSEDDINILRNIVNEAIEELDGEA